MKRRTSFPSWFLLLGPFPLHLRITLSLDLRRPFPLARRSLQRPKLRKPPPHGDARGATPFVHTHSRYSYTPPPNTVYKRVVAQLPCLRAPVYAAGDFRPGPTVTHTHTCARARVEQRGGAYVSALDEGSAVRKGTWCRGEF